MSDVPWIILLLSQFKTNKANLNDIARFCGKGVMSGLVINVSSVRTSCILYIPGSIAIPQACMLAGDEVIIQHNGACRPPANRCLWGQLKARSRENVAGSTINHDQVADTRWGVIVITGIRFS